MGFDVIVTALALSAESLDQSARHLDVDADYLSRIRPQLTPEFAARNVEDLETVGAIFAVDRPA